MVLLDASSAAPSVAEGGQVWRAIWGLVHTLLHARSRGNHDKKVNAVDTGQSLHVDQRATGTEGGSRQVRRQLWLDCRVGGRRFVSDECQGESHGAFVLIQVQSFPVVSSPQPSWCAGVSASWERNPRNLPVAFYPSQTSETAAVGRNTLLFSNMHVDIMLHQIRPLLSSYEGLIFWACWLP